MSNGKELALKLVKEMNIYSVAYMTMVSLFTQVAEGKPDLVQDMVSLVNDRTDLLMELLAAECQILFTEKELECIVEFYNSEAGKKWISQFDNLQFAQAEATGHFVSSIVRDTYAARGQELPEGWKEIFAAPESKSNIN